MLRSTVQALLASLVTFALCGLAYPAATWLVAQAVFPREAEGSLVRGPDGDVVGSSLIGQSSKSDRYFHPRPSAVEHDASASGGSNLATTNPDQRRKMADRLEALGASNDAPAPADLATASGSGLDPHISPEAARWQVDRVARARDVPPRRVRELVEARVETSGGILGAPPRVNVLLLNRALDESIPRLEAR